MPEPTEYTRRAFAKLRRRLHQAEQREDNSVELSSPCRKLEAENRRLRRRLEIATAANERRRRLLRFFHRAPLLAPAGRLSVQWRSRRNQPPA
jgi:hypothetical protein